MNVEAIIHCNEYQKKIFFVFIYPEKPLMFNVPLRPRTLYALMY